MSELCGHLRPNFCQAWQRYFAKLSTYVGKFNAFGRWSRAGGKLMDDISKRERSSPFIFLGRPVCVAEINGISAKAPALPELK